MSMQPYRRTFPSSFAAGAVSRMGYAYPRARAAIGIGKFAYENRAAIFRAAKLITKAAKRYNSKKNRRENFSAANIGKDIGTADTKKAGVVDDDDVIGGPLYDTRTLYKRQLVVISPGMQDNQRMGTAVNLKGIKICTNWLNESLDVNNGLECHLAVIAPKENNAKSFAAGEFEEDFFGAWGFNGSNRAVNFSTALSSIDFGCYPINTDKWVVLKHKRFNLSRVAQTHAPMNTYYQQHHFYLKINRQVQFSSMAENANPDNPIYLVWWCDNWMEQGGFAGRANQLRMECKAITYFTDICKC